MNEKPISFKHLRGSEISNWLKQIAELRIQIFREWPYLYDGSLEYEVSYLRRYTKAERSFVIIALDGEQVIGASSCIWLPEESEMELKKPFIEYNFNLEKGVYFGESVLYSQYRGQGIGAEFMRIRESFAKDECAADYAAFCSVVRLNEHELKPDSYVPLDDFWTRRGFKRVQGMECQLCWKDIDKPQEDYKKLNFWVKNFKEDFHKPLKSS